MNRPIESDYTSQVAYTRALEEYCNAMGQPAAWITPDGEGFRIRFSAPTSDVPLGWEALYTAPPKRPWVELTNEDIANAGLLTVEGEMMLPYSFARAILAKSKELNT